MKPPVDTETDQPSQPSTLESRYRCVCGMTTESMSGFVDHVSDSHDALDVAVQALLDEELEVEIDA